MKSGKINKKTEKVFKESHVLVMLEDMRDHIKLLAEGQMGFHDKFESIEGRFDSIDQRFERIDERFERVEHKLDTMSEENKIEHKAIMEYLSRLENEMMDIKEKLGSKADKGEYEFLKKRVDNLEQQMKKFKVLLKVKNTRV